MVGCLAASLASIDYIPAILLPQYDNEKYLQMSNVSWGAESSLWKTTELDGLFRSPQSPLRYVGDRESSDSIAFNTENGTHLFMSLCLPLDCIFVRTETISIWVLLSLQPVAWCQAQVLKERINDWMNGRWDPVSPPVPSSLCQVLWLCVGGGCREGYLQKINKIND